MRPLSTDRDTETADLVRKCVQGDPDGPRELMRRYEGLVRYAVRTVLVGAGDAEAEDPIQIAWIRIFSGLAKWRQRCSLPSYLRVIAVRATIDFLREERRALPTASPDSGPMDRCEPTVERLVREEEIGQLGLAMQQLRPDLKKQIDLWMGGATTPEIAHAMGKSPRTIQLRMRAILAQLRGTMQTSDISEKTCRETDP